MGIQYFKLNKKEIIDILWKHCLGSLLINIMFK